MVIISVEHSSDVCGNCHTF